MADFLTRLVERNMGVGPAVQPVVAPIFAPPPVAEDGLPGPAAQEPASRPGPAHADARPSLQPPGVPALAEPPAAPARPVAMPHTPQPTPQPAEPPAHPLPPRPGVPIARRLEETGVERREAADAGGAIVHLAAPPTTRPALVNETAPADETAHTTPARPQLGTAPLDAGVPPPAHAVEASPQPGRPPDQPGAAGHQRAEQPPHPTTPPHPALSPAERHPSAALVEQRQSARPRSEGATLARPQMISSPERAAADQASQPPTIRVSIGRIDVRAVSAPQRQAPQRQAPAAPKLSLDEYLRRQNGGKR